MNSSELRESFLPEKAPCILRLTKSYIELEFSIGLPHPMDAIDYEEGPHFGASYNRGV